MYQIKNRLFCSSINIIIRLKCVSTQKTVCLLGWMGGGGGGGTSHKKLLFSPLQAAPAFLLWCFQNGTIYVQHRAD